MSLPDLNLKIEDSLIKKLAAEIDKYKLFALGEIHGVSENYSLIYTLFKTFSFTCIALELPNNIKQLLINNHLSSINELKFEDGRVSVELFELFKKLNSEGLLKHVIFFDNDGFSATYEKGSWNYRDENMALSFIDQFNPEYKTILVAGNVHTRNYVFDGKDGSKMKPLIYNLQESIGKFPTGKIKYLSGSYYNFGVHKFEGMPNLKQVNELNINEEGVYTITISTATPVTPFV